MSKSASVLVAAALIALGAGPAFAEPPANPGQSKKTKTVFVSSKIFIGNLGGLAGADHKCQDMADGAGLAGRYKAWLSDVSSSPSDRFVRSTVPYALTDGTIVASDFTDLTDGALMSPISVTENGLPVDPFTLAVWTGTQIDGTRVMVSSQCDDWTNSEGDGATGGNAFLPDASWTDRISVFFGCGGTVVNIYCFEQ